MIDVKVNIHNKDRKIGAMVKALAFEIAGPSSVVGTSKEYLEAHGYYVFHFPTVKKANEFKESLAMYLPALMASVFDKQSPDA